VAPGPPEPPGPTTAQQDEAWANALSERFAAETAERIGRLRLSRRLTEIDSVLRAQLHTAACSSMVRVLEKAGAKLRQTAGQRKFRDMRGNDGVAKTMIASTPNYLVAWRLGRGLVAAMGYPDHHALLATDWADLKPQFYEWVGAAQRQAVLTAAQLAGVRPKSKSVALVTAKMTANLDAAWDAFADAMSKTAEALLYNPMPNAPDPGTVEFNPLTVVPVGIVRRVIGIAGGSGRAQVLTASPIPQIDVTEDDVGRQSDPGQASVTLGGIGTGSDVSDFLGDNGMQVQTFTWEHNYAGDKPLEGHLALDGISFTSFTDDVLINNDSFPDNEYFVPGDHDGCMCDYVSEWGSADDTTTDDSVPDSGDDATDSTDADAIDQTTDEDMSGEADDTTQAGPVDGRDYPVESAYDFGVQLPDWLAGTPDANFSILTDGEDQFVLSETQDYHAIPTISLGDTTAYVNPDSGWDQTDPMLLESLRTVQAQAPDAGIRLSTGTTTDSKSYADVWIRQVTDNPMINLASRDKWGAGAGGDRYASFGTKMNEHGQTKWFMPVARNIQNDNDAARYIMSHEMGHLLQGATGDVDATSEAVIDKLAAMSGHSKIGFLQGPNDKMGQNAAAWLQLNGMSRYSTTHILETIAEAHAGWAFGARSDIINAIAEVFDWAP
jgi:hypothetical protein